MKNNDNKHKKRAFKISEAAEYACVGRSTVENWLANTPNFINDYGDSIE